MLIPFEQILSELKKHNIQITGILELGACYAEEGDIYTKYGIHDFLMVEANPSLIPHILCKWGYDRTVLALIGEKDGVLTDFNIMMSDDKTNPGCSSTLRLGLHAELYPMIKQVGQIKMPTLTVDSLMRNRWEFRGAQGFNYNTLVMDLQGSELSALKGAGEFLKTCKVIISEFALVPLYEGACTLDQIDAFLEPLGFKRVITKIVEDPRARGLWGDLLMVKA